MKKTFTSAFFLAALALFTGASALYANNPVIGIIDGVSRDSTYYPWHHVSGWACAWGLPNSIDVHVYAGGPAGVGQYVTAVTANRASDQAVAGACGSTGTAYRFSIPLDDFLAAHFGKSIYIHGISPNGGPNYLISNSGSFTFPDGITVNVLGHPMRIQTPPTLGGAIGSLTWRGMEFVNRDDHGREFQVAAQFNDYGECFNPTEAGSSDDGAWTNPSTSQVYSYQIPAPNFFWTGSFPAFWLKYGQTTPYCSNTGPGQNGGNLNPRSNFNTYKQVEVGYLGLENVIRVKTDMYIPHAVTDMKIESFLGVMNYADFPKTLTYDVVNHTATTTDTPGAYPNGQTYVNRPVIVASNANVGDENNYAFAIYNRELLAQNNPYHQVGWYRLGPTPDYGITSWSAVFDFAETSGPTSRFFTNYLIIGNLRQVLETMRSLHCSFQSCP